MENLEELCTSKFGSLNQMQNLKQKVEHLLCGKDKKDRRIAVQAIECKKTVW